MPHSFAFLPAKAWGTDFKEQIRFVRDLVITTITAPALHRRRKKQWPLAGKSLPRHKATAGANWGAATMYEAIIRDRYGDLADEFLRLYPGGNMQESILAATRDIAALLTV